MTLNLRVPSWESRQPFDNSRRSAQFAVRTCSTSVRWGTFLNIVCIEDCHSRAIVEIVMPYCNLTKVTKTRQTSDTFIFYRKQWNSPSADCVMTRTASSVAHRCESLIVNGRPWPGSLATCAPLHRLLLCLMLHPCFCSFSLFKYDSTQRSPFSNVMMLFRPLECLWLVITVLGSVRDSMLILNRTRFLYMMWMKGVV